MAAPREQTQNVRTLVAMLRAGAIEHVAYSARHC
jgi:hypothetical protein